MQVTYQHKGHVYWNEDGSQVPGVSKILGKTVIKPFFEKQGRQPDPDFRDWTAKRGIEVHKACYLDCLDALDEDSIDEIVRPFFAGWERARDEMGIKPIKLEELVWHDELGYAGRLDLLSYVDVLAPIVLIDLKASRTCWPWHRLQAAAYNMAAIDRGLVDGPIPRMVLLLKGDGGYDASHIWYEEDGFEEWVECVKKYHAPEEEDEWWTD